MHRSRWRIEILSRAHARSQRMRRRAQDNGIFVALDDFYEAITSWSPRARVMNWRRQGLPRQPTSAVGKLRRRGCPPLADGRRNDLRRIRSHADGTRAACTVVLAACASAMVFVACAGAGKGGTGRETPLTVTHSGLRLTFLDVGQGDAVLLRAPGGKVALVDAGPGEVVHQLREFGVDTIDLAVATHPHADHIGGMVGVIETLPVRVYMDNGQPHTTKTYERLRDALDARPGITYLEATPRTLMLGEVMVDVLPLLPRETTDFNDRSIALVVRYGSFTAFLSGDSGVRQLTHLLDEGRVPETVLLKAAHHGSDDAFTEEFLDVAEPRVVVISVGRHNPYGHPAPAALDAFRATGAKVFRTDLHGDVSVTGFKNGEYEVVYGDQTALQGARFGH